MNLQLVLEILGIVIPLIHAAGLVMAGHAVLRTRTSQGAIAWALSLIFFPYVAIPLYLVFGRRKFLGYIEARRRGDRDIDHQAEKVLAAVRPAKSCFAGDRERFCVLQSLTMMPFCGGNRARLLVDGTATFDAIFAAIDAAKDYLLVQFFIVRDDDLGRELQQRLIQKARGGVRVYFLFDEVGSITLPARYLHALREAGVHAEPFHTRQGWKNRFQINFRNHHKIVVADGRVAFVGGHNVGDEYLGKSKRFGHWRDTHVEVSGPVVAAVQWSFLEDWHWATGDILDLPVVTGELPVGGGTGGAGDSTCDAIAIPSGPADEKETCTFMFLAAIAAARQRLWITSPYFVPDESVYAALQLAALRGVDVRIMLPAKADHLLVYLSAFSYLDSAERVGVKFYRYGAGFLHQKVMLIDDDLAAVGTANLDNRSLKLNFEITLFFADVPFAAAVAAMLEKDFAQCERATRGDLKRRGLPFRLAVVVARLFSPVQ